MAHTLLKVVGWALYALTAMYTFSALVGNYQAARSGATVTKMGLFLLGVGLVCLPLFGLSELSKLHLAWVIPLAWMVSFTRSAQALGSALGEVFEDLFGRHG